MLHSILPNILEVAQYYDPLLSLSHKGCSLLVAIHPLRTETHFFCCEPVYCPVCNTLATVLVVVMLPAITVMMIMALWLVPSSSARVNRPCRDQLAMLQSEPQDFDMDGLLHKILQDEDTYDEAEEEDFTLC